MTNINIKRRFQEQELPDMKGFKENHIDAKLIMGGLINENRDGSDLPVDVTEQVRALGVNCDNKAEDLVKNILAIDKEYRL